MMYIIEVPGRPEGKARPRVGKHGHFYSPDDAQGWDSRVRACARATGVRCLDGPVEMHMTVSHPMPKSWSNAKRERYEGYMLYAVRKPDLDNVVKSTMDALTGIAWHDDRQVVHIDVCRVWSDEPTVINIRSLPEDA